MANNGNINIQIHDNSGVGKSYVDGKVAQEASARQESDTALYLEIQGKADDSGVVKAIILNGTTYVPASGTIDLGTIDSVPVVVKSETATVVPGMLGRNSINDQQLEVAITGGSWRPIIAQTASLFNKLSAPPANASDGYIMFNTTTHKLLVRYGNKWWDAMGNEVTTE